MKAQAIAQASQEKKATDVLILHIAKLTSVADYLVICSGESERQVKAIADHVDSALSSQRGGPLSIEGTSSAQWILMDFGDVVTHIFRSDIRDHYRLEKLWPDAGKVRVPAAPVVVSSAPRPRTRPRTVRVRKQG